MNKHEQQIQRAEEAARVVNSAVFAEAFAEVRAAYLRTWEGLPSVSTAEGLEHVKDLHCRLKALNDVRKALETHIQTGRLAEKEVSRRERLASMARKLNPFANTPGGM